MKKTKEYLERYRIWLAEKYVETGGLITVRDAAKICGYTESSLYKKLHQDQLTKYQFREQIIYLSVKEVFGLLS